MFVVYVRYEHVRYRCFARVRATNDFEARRKSMKAVHAEYGGPEVSQVVEVDEPHVGYPLSSAAAI